MRCSARGSCHGQAMRARLQLIARLELIIGTAHLIAETGGIANRPFVGLEMGELVSYAGMFKALLRAAEIDCARTPGGHYALGNTAHLRPLITLTSERIINIFEHIATSAPVFTPTAEDFDVPQLRPLLDVYGRGKGVDAVYRHRLCRLAWELTSELVRRPAAALRAAALGISRGHHHWRVSALRQEQGDCDGQQADRRMTSRDMQYGTSAASRV